MYMFKEWGLQNTALTKKIYFVHLWFNNLKLLLDYSQNMTV